MGVTFETDEVILLLDNYGDDSRKLHKSFLQAELLHICIRYCLPDCRALKCTVQFLGC